MIPKEPAKITDKKFRFDSFKNGKVFDGNKKALPYVRTKLKKQS